VTLSLILAVSTSVPKPRLEYTPRYSYYYSISKNKDLKNQIKEVKSRPPLEIANTVTVEQPEAFLIDTDQTLSKEQIVGLIRDYSVKYGVDPERSIRIAKCESGFNPNAKSKNGLYFGLFQFLPSTFRANAKRLGLQNPNILNPDHNIEVATYMFNLNQYHQWSCK
jgi:soluble lytic murein transglycosylase-like protein